MKKVIFGTALVLGTIFTSCNSELTSVEVKPTGDSLKVATPVEATTVTTPSVDSAKVDEKKPEGKK
jgi:hypothetical protein